MSPTTTSFSDHHAKMNSNNGLRPPPLRINKDSHMIKKSSLSSSSSSSSPSSLRITAGPNKPIQRQPVIIYTHSPKIIHTHPKDFMALVQKLTGRSHSEDDDQAAQTKQEKCNPMPEVEAGNVKTVVGNVDNESSSVTTTDENCGSIGDGQVKSCIVVPPIIDFEPPNLYNTNIPLFTPNSADLLCPSQPFYNYTDPLFLSPNMRGSISSAMEAMKEIQEY